MFPRAGLKICTMSLPNFVGFLDSGTTRIRHILTRLYRSSIRVHCKLQSSQLAAIGSPYSSLPDFRMQIEHCESALVCIMYLGDAESVLLYIVRHVDRGVYILVQCADEGICVYSNFHNSHVITNPQLRDQLHI